MTIPKFIPRSGGFALFLSLLLFTACSHHRTLQAEEQGDTLPLRYARNLTIVEYGNRTEVTIRDPWDTTAVLHRYVLVPAQADLPAHTDLQSVLRVPLRHVGVFTSVHCGLLHELGHREAIRGICEIQYINLPYVQEGVRTGRIANFGSAMEPTIEVIMDAQPDALLISPFENSGGYGRVERLGIPIIECADYMEYSPLARAEWMKFYGRLFGESERADSLFCEVERRYLSLRARASKVTHRPTLIAEKPYSGVWYVPGGGSVMGILYRDAGADYLYADRPETGSLPLSVETVFEKAQSADFWIIKYNQNQPLTLSQLRSDYPPFAHFRAFQSGRVYGCNQFSSHFYEETPYHPDLLLADLVRIFHPELGIEAEKSYFCSVEK